ncbi:hypothetical protein GCM10010517_71070 [Streptosporangium fragile]|uniref:Uncharacterized protein n=1 Tax=Streptosporangium fragile TaxID=46186 RepID=A0ABN3W7W6_9ACTN
MGGGVPLGGHQPYERISPRSSRAFGGAAVRQTLDLGGGSAGLRVRLSNRYGSRPLNFWNRT